MKTRNKIISSVLNPVILHQMHQLYKEDKLNKKFLKRISTRIETQNQNFVQTELQFFINQIQIKIFCMIKHKNCMIISNFNKSNY